MAELMDEVDQRTNLAFSNQMEMLTFFLSDAQQYGINVFKIIEVLETPGTITTLPQAHPAVVGAIDFRDHAVTIIDLSHAMGMEPVDHRGGISYIIVCEYSNSTQGFLISHPNKLINKSWGDVHSPGGALANAGYLTAITYDEEGRTIQILDIEKILGEIVGIDDQVSQELIRESQQVVGRNHRVLVVDDSKAARALLQSTLEQMGVQHTVLDDASRALAELEQSLEPGGKPYSLIISDIEMPGMDGFTFTRKVKANPSLASIHLVLHSSMSNQSNRLKAKQVGANDFIPKFRPNEIARTVIHQLRVSGQAAGG